MDANVGAPQVAYRETIRKRVDKVEGRFVRQTGGHGQYGHVVHRDRAERVRCRLSCSRARSSAASIPKEYIPAVDAGIKEALRGAASWPGTRSSTSRCS